MLSLYAIGCLLFGYLYFVRDDSLPRWYAICTSSGAWGHQVWSMMVYKHRAIEIGVALYYFAQGGRFSGIPRPALCVQLLKQPLALGAVLAYVLLGPEAGSIWCWAASCLCFAYLIEPWVIDACHVLDPRFIDSSDAADQRRAELKLADPMAYWACNYMWMHMADRTDFVIGAQEWAYEGERRSLATTDMLPWREKRLAREGP